MPMIGRQRPSMTAYKPTVRDNVARAALNLFGDTYANRKFARNMFGSSGLGSTGKASLADFTPAGVGFAADEAGRQAGQGHPWAAAANLALAAVPIPAVAKGAKGMIGKGLRTVEKKAAPYIEAYHGSPHTFDQFSLDKIGTGEGAQAYGHGLYFAEQEGVAKNYRDALTNKRIPDGEHIDKVAFNVVRAGPNKTDAELVPFVRNAYPNAPDDRIAQAIATARANQQTGSMYQVRINADPNDFLDWDAPLHGQSPKVQDALRGFFKDTAPTESYTVSQTASGRHTVRNVWGEVVGTYKSPEAAAKVVEDGNRSQFRGGGGLAYTRLGGNPIYGDKGEASAKLAEAGIPGIKYLDQGSRGAGEGSRNFVVFDPKIIDIMKRYGVAAPVAAAILAGTVPRPAEAKDQPNLFRQPGQ